MKSFHFFLLLGLAAALFSNCKKDDDSNEFEGIRITVDGTEWVAPTATGAALSDKITISGVDPATFKSLLLVVSADIAAGTYDIKPFGDVQVSFSGGSTSLYTPKSGKLVVTEHDKSGKRFKATFEFEGENGFSGGTASFTDGEVNVAYQ
jgi:hypothetical protein